MFSLFVAYLKIGAFSVGGGYAMLPLIYQTVLSFEPMSKEVFSNMVAISQITPGPVAVNIATYTGFDLYGWPGAMIASLAVCLPCFVFSLALAGFLRRHNDVSCLNKVIEKMKICGVALIAVSGTFLAEGSIYLTDTTSNLPQIDFLQVTLFLLSILIYAKKVLGPVALTFIMAGLSVAGDYIINLLQKLV